MNIREKILIVEDEKSISHFISTILNSNGYETIQALSLIHICQGQSGQLPDIQFLTLKRIPVFGFFPPFFAFCRRRGSLRRRFLSLRPVSYTHLRFVLEYVRAAAPSLDANNLGMACAS